MATPIGNLGDASHRSLEVLAGVSHVLAEDTRRTRKLMAHYGVRTPMRSHHEHNEQQQIPGLIEQLQRGEDLALVTDAGTPAVSDPGYRLVRAAIDAGLRVVPIPGPSAPLAALVGSGLPTHRFTFVGYPPRKSAERRRFLAGLREEPGTLLLLESPRRLRATLQAAAQELGGSRPAAIARELTKKHEEFLRGSLEQLLELLPETPLRGETTLCIGGAEASARAPLSAAQLRQRYGQLLGEGTARAEALRLLVAESGLRRRQVYEAVVLGADDSPPHSGDDS